jgi:phage tail-like protein
MPLMPTTGRERTGSIVDPLATFKFHVEIENIREALFTECSGLEMSTEVEEYKEGGMNGYIHKFPGRTKYSNVTLKRGFTLSNELFDWFRKLETGIATGEKNLLKQVTITLYSTAEQKTKVKWHLDNAFPVKWVGPAMKTSEAASAVESIEFAHQGIKIDK